MFSADYIGVASILASRQYYQSADKSLARPGRQATATSADYTGVASILASRQYYQSADKYLARPGRQATATKL
jgi:hypothetical protein